MGPELAAFGSPALDLTAIHLQLSARCRHLQSLHVAPWCRLVCCLIIADHVNAPVRLTNMRKLNRTCMAVQGVQPAVHVVF